MHEDQVIHQMKTIAAAANAVANLYREKKQQDPEPRYPLCDPQRRWIKTLGQYDLPILENTRRYLIVTAKEAGIDIDGLRIITWFATGQKKTTRILPEQVPHILSLIEAWSTL